jgi:hypothetical protein
MRRVVFHAKLPLDYLGYPGTGPNLTPKPKAFRTARQQVRDLLAFCGTQTPWCTGFGTILERYFSAFPDPSDPLADSSFGHAEGFGNILLLPACLVQSPGSLASFFFPTRRLFLSHVVYQTTV